MNTKFKMDESTIADLLINKMLKIPIYQRKYTWQKEHVDALVDDIISRAQDNSDHFFGVIALTSTTESINSRDVTISKVIDGQQRLTTSLILLHYFYSRVKEIDAEVLHALSSNNGIHFRHEISSSSLKDNIQNLFSNNYGSLVGQFKNNFMRIQEKFAKYDDKEIQKFYEVFRNNFKILILKYEINSNEEMLVFENLNSKGSPLKSFDLIRNHIIRLYEHDAQFALQNFNKYIWNLTKQGEFYESSDMKAEKKLERFFELFLIFKFKNELKKFTNYSIYKNFKEYKSKIMKKNEFINFLKELNKYEILYFSLINQKGVGENIWIQTLSQKDNYMPLVFHLFDKFGEYNDLEKKWIINDTIEDYLQVVTSHLIKLMSVAGTGQSFTKMWINISRLIVNNEYSAKQIKQLLKEGKIVGSDETPSNVQFEKSLLMTPKQKWLPKALLNILEYHHSLETNEKIFYSKKSLEHILPQKANIKDWPIIEDEEEYKQCVNLIGNLVFYDVKKNSGLGNRAFDIKKEKYEVSSSPLISGKTFDLQPLYFYNDFTFKDIKERTKKLIKILLEYI